MSNRQQLQLPADCTVRVTFPYAAYVFVVENGLITKCPLVTHLIGREANKVMLNYRRHGAHISWRSQ